MWRIFAETVVIVLDRLMVVLRTVNHLMPKFVGQFPFNVLLWDLDWRIRTGRPLV